MRVKAADWKCLEEKAQMSRKHCSPLVKKPSTLTVLHFAHLLYSVTGSCSTYTIFYIKINNVSSVIIKYISVLDLSPL